MSQQTSAENFRIYRKQKLAVAYWKYADPNYLNLIEINW